MYSKIGVWITILGVMAGCTPAPIHTPVPPDAQSRSDTRSALDGGEMVGDVSTPVIDSGHQEPPYTGHLEQDSGEMSFDASFAQDAKPPTGEAGVPSADASIPSFDASIPSFDASIPSLPDIGTALSQTVVSVSSASPLLITINLMPIVAPDPINVKITLDFQNPGSTHELLSITQGFLIIAPPMPPQPPSQLIQSFAMEPDHNAPPGLTTKMFSKTVNSGTPAMVMNPQDFCNRNAFVTVEMSNGAALVANATTACVY